MLIKDAEINGQRLDIRCRGKKIVHVGRNLPACADDQLVIDAHGGALLPGLHDHHLHFAAWQSALQSLDCSHLDNPADLAEMLAAAPAQDWLRGVGYREDGLGDLDHAQLENLLPGRAVRLQHGSGKMWLLNTTACQRLKLDQYDLPGIERDATGRVTGRLFRMDQWLAAQLQPDRAAATDRHSSWQSAARQLLAYGITGFTDASYTNTAAVVPLFDELPQHTWLMGDESLPRGPLKVMLDEDRLPALDSLVQRVSAAHSRQRSVAFHCVTRVELLVALTALREAGVIAGDRIEHGAVIPAELIEVLLELGVCVVTQPGFVSHRGERFRLGLSVEEQTELYRFGSLLAAGVPVVASSDAPYGPVSPWQIMQAAMTRHTDSGEILGAVEMVSPLQALAGYLTPAPDPAGAPRQIAPGQPADLCLLGQSWAELCDAGLAAAQVQHTIIDGQQLYSADSTSSVCSPN